MSVLNPGGFILLEIPAENVQPLQIVVKGKNGSAILQNFTIKDLFKDSDYALPIMSDDIELSNNLQMIANLNLDIESNVSVLEGLLKLIGANASADFDYKKIKNATLKLNSGKKNNVNEFKLDAYINKATLSEESATFKKMLMDDDVYVITEIIKSNDYAIDTSNSNATNVNVNIKVPETGEIDSGVNNKTDHTSSQTYKGNKYITLGIRAYRILYNKSFWGKGGFRIRLDEDIKTVKGDERFKGDSLNADSINNQE